MPAVGGGAQRSARDRTDGDRTDGVSLLHVASTRLSAAIQPTDSGAKGSETVEAEMLGDPARAIESDRERGLEPVHTFAQVRRWSGDGHMEVIT